MPHADSPQGGTDWGLLPRPVSRTAWLGSPSHSRGDAISPPSPMNRTHATSGKTQTTDHAHDSNKERSSSVAAWLWEGCGTVGRRKGGYAFFSQRSTEPEKGAGEHPPPLLSRRPLSRFLSLAAAIQAYHAYLTSSLYSEHTIKAFVGDLSLLGRFVGPQQVS